MRKSQRATFGWGFAVSNVSSLVRGIADAGALVVTAAGGPAAVADALSTVGKHADLIALMVDAIERRGVSSEQLATLIKQAMVEASDEMMKHELGDT